jgi:hypothetical protein
MWQTITAVSWENMCNIPSLQADMVRFMMHIRFARRGIMSDDIIS